jgi:serine/threonine protein kinase
MNARVSGDPEAPRKVNPALSPALEEVILHALERDPRQRYQTAAEMKRDLDDLSAVTITHRDERLRAPQPWRSRGHWLLIGAAVLLLQVVLFIGLYVFLARKH